MKNQHKILKVFCLSLVLLATIISLSLNFLKASAEDGFDPEIEPTSTPKEISKTNKDELAIEQISALSNYSSIGILGNPISIVSYSDSQTAIYFNGIQQFYGNSASGVFIWVEGDVYGPIVPAGNELSTYTPISLTKTGTGIASNPWLIKTLIRVGNSGLRLEQTLQYINGNNYVNYFFRVYNDNSYSITYDLFHAADFYTNNDDLGYGYYNRNMGAVGGYVEDKSTYNYFYPNTPGSKFFEGEFFDVWDRIGYEGEPGSGFNNTYIADEYIDNGGGLQWHHSIPAHGSDLISDTFSVGDLGSINALDNFYKQGEQITNAANKSLDYLLISGSDTLNKGVEIAGDTAAETLFFFVSELFSKFGDSIISSIKPLTGISEKATTVLKDGVIDISSNLYQASLEISEDGNPSHNNWATRLMHSFLSDSRQLVFQKYNQFNEAIRDNNIIWNPEYEKISKKWVEKINNTHRTKIYINFEMIGPFFIPSLTTYNIQLTKFDFNVRVFEDFLPYIQDLILYGLIIAIVALAIVGIVYSGFTTAGPIIALVTSLVNINNFTTIFKIGIGAWTFSLALSIIFSGSSIIAPEIQKSHNNGLTELEQISYTSGLDFSGLSTDVFSVNGNEANFVTTLTNNGMHSVNPLIHTYIYDTAGHLVDILSSKPRLVSGENTDINSQVFLPSGKYKVISVIHTSEAVGLSASPPLSFELTYPNIDLDLTFENNHVELGEPISTNISLQNNGSQSSNTLSVIAIQGDAQSQAWYIELGAGKSRNINYNFVPKTCGQLSVVVLSDSKIISQINRPYNVDGCSQSISINIDPEEDFPHSNDILIDLEAENAGINQANSNLEWVTSRLDGDFTDVYTGNLVIQTNANSKSQYQIMWLEHAQPGSYSTTFYLDGKFYSSYPFNVISDNSLSSLINSPEDITVGEQSTFDLEIYDISFINTNVSSANLIIKNPIGETNTITMNPVATGFYQGTFTPLQNGTYEIESDIIAPGNFIVPENKYFVVSTPSSLVANIQGELLLQQVSNITFTVTNENGIAISDARISLKNPDSIISQVTNNEGKASLSIRPEKIVTYQVQIEKTGYIGSQEFLEVQQPIDNIPPSLVVNLPEFTSKNYFDISGITEVGSKVNVNGQSVTPDSIGKFHSRIFLTEGDNNITITSTDLSNNITTVQNVIKLDQNSPEITIHQPYNDEIVSGTTLLVSGITEPNLSININGTWTTSDDLGNFSLWTPTRNGNNTISITVQDKAGNESQKTLSFFVTSSPTLAIVSPNWAMIGGSSLNINILGVNFSPESIVFWNDQPLITEMIDSTHIKANIPQSYFDYGGVDLITIHQSNYITNSKSFAVYDPNSNTPIALSPGNYDKTGDWNPEFKWTNLNNAFNYHLKINKGSKKIYDKDIPITIINCFENTCSFKPPINLVSGPYNWQIKALFPTGSGPWSEPQVFYTPEKPGQIENLFNPISNMTISGWKPAYSWEGLDEANQYKLEIWKGKVRIFSKQLSRMDADCLNDEICDFQADKTLTSGTYKWRICAINNTGQGNWSEWEYFSTPGAPLGIPPIYSPSSGQEISDWQPNLAWGNVSEATKYNINIQQGKKNIQNIWVDSLETGCFNNIQCKYQIQTPLKNGLFRWRIRAGNPSGYSGWSEWEEFNIPTGLILLEPEPVFPVYDENIYDWSPVYIWKRTRETRLYILEIWKGSKRIETISVTPKDANCEINETCSIQAKKTLKSGIYKWHVKSSNAISQSAWSNWQNFSTPPVPEKINQSNPNGSLDSPTLIPNWQPVYYWGKSVNALSYQIELWKNSKRINNFQISSEQALCTNNETCSFTSPIINSKGVFRWRIRGINPSGNGEWSDWKYLYTFDVPVQVTSTISPVQNIIVDNWQPTVSWLSVSNSLKYQILIQKGTKTIISETVTSSDLNCISEGELCTYIPQKFLGSGIHKWKVRAWNPSGFGIWSTPISFSTKPAPGQIGILISPENDTNNQLPVYTWAVQDNFATHYDFEVYKSRTVVFHRIIAIQNLNCTENAEYSFKPLVELSEGDYKWRIRGWNNSGFGKWSDFKTFSVSFAQSEQINSTITITETSFFSNGIRLVWESNQLEKNDFIVEKSTNGEDEWKQININNSDLSTFVDSDIYCNTKYFYRIRASGTISNTSEVSTPPCPMLPPISLKPENITEKELGFSWVSQSVDASKIIVERLTSDNEEWDEIEELSGAENHFLDANLECNKKYAYRLKVFRESDNQFSDYSDVIQITTSECSLLFFDDFSNDKQWINLSDNNIYRDIKNNYIAWDVTNETSRRFYHSIDTQVDRIKISFDFKITNNNNGSLAIGLVENLDAPTQIEEIDATGIFVRLFHADDADWIGVLANYLDSSYYDTESFIRQPEINHIGKAVLIINKGNWNLTISDDEANITEQQSGLLPSQHLAYQYVMLVSDKTGGHGSQSGIIDNLTIEKYNP